jgi:hypothetical protein
MPSALECLATLPAKPPVADHNRYQTTDSMQFVTSLSRLPRYFSHFFCRLFCRQPAGGRALSLSWTYFGERILTL